MRARPGDDTFVERRGGNPLTALALDLQSGESPFLFQRSYVYPFDRDKFDSALSRSISSQPAKPEKYA
jgi:hypothetical protein